MANTRRFGFGVTVEDGRTYYTAAQIIALHGITDTYLAGIIDALGRGVISGLVVTAGTGASVNIAAGSGIIDSADYGGVPFVQDPAGTLAIPENGRFYVFATVEESTNRTVATGIPVFSYSALNTSPDSLLLAVVTLAAGAVTSVVDMRTFVSVAGNGPLESQFAQDGTTTLGLEWGYLSGVVRDDEAVTVVAAGAVELEPSTTNYVELDPTDGTVSAGTGGFTAGFIPLRQITTNADGITASVDVRTWAFAGGAAGIVGVTASGGLSATGTTTRDISISDGGVTDAKVGNRTVDQTLATPANTGTLTQLLSWIVRMLKAFSGEADWKTAPATTLSAAATHIAASAPHAGHLKADGTVAMGADFDAGGFKITNLADGVASSDAATVAQVDAVASGYRDLLEAKCTSAVNVVLSGPQTMDGVSAIADDRVFLWNQDTKSENGPWIVKAGVWDRPTDFDTGDTPSPGLRIFIVNGTSYKSSSWALITDSATVDTDPLDWTRTNVAATGEINTTSNTGSGAQVGKAKSGVDLPLRTIAAGSSKVTSTQGTDDISIDVVEANLDMSNMTGAPLVAHGGSGVTASTAGGLVYGNGTNTRTELAGNGTATRKFAMMVSNVLSWAQLVAADLPVFIGSGPTSARGAVPDPGATAGSAKYLREDATWATLPVSLGGLPLSTIDAKGDLLAGTAADTVARLAVGSNGQILQADSGETTGVKWATKSVTAAQISDSTAAGRALLTAADVAAQKTALGLGGAAVLSVGTTAGTVAAGDDSRLSNTRTPTDNTVSTAKIVDDAVTADKLANTAVTPGSYGDATHVPQVTVDAQGRLTAVTEVSITGAADGSGYAEIDVTGFSGTKVLTEAESQCGNILFTGAAAGDLVYQVFDATPRMWHVAFNQTGGALVFCAPGETDGWSAATSGGSRVLKLDANGLMQPVEGEGGGTAAGAFNEADLPDPEGYTEGTTAYVIDQDTGAMVTGTTWREVALGRVMGMWGVIAGIKGYFAGGGAATADKLTFSTDTTSAQSSANLSGARDYTSGVSEGSTKGYFGGGSAPTAVTDKTVFSTDTTTAQSSANLSSSRGRGTAMSERATKGYFVGGYNGGANVVTTDKIVFSTDTTSAESGANDTVARRYMMSITQGTTKGYVLGGYTGSELDTAAKIDYASDTTAGQTSANLSSVRRSTAGVSNGTSYGYVAGGSNGSRVLVADRLVFATDTTAAQTSANLSTARDECAACSQGAAKAYFVGGNTGSTTASAEKLTFSTETCSASGSAALSSAREALAGLSDVGL